MALIKCDFFSEELMISTSMTVILPEQTKTQIGLKNNRNGDKFPTLYLLHGLSDDHTIWSRRTSIERYAAEYGIAVIMPQVDHSFYADMVYGKKYWTFISEELPRIARSFFPLSAQKEDNFVAGLSMGGYGAFKWALRKPEEFAAAASLSGVLDIADHVKNIKEDNPIGSALFQVYGGKEIEDTQEDLFYLIQQLKAKKESIPLLFQACGTEDFLWEENQKFYQFAQDQNLPLTHTFTSGTHEWGGYWDQKIQEVLAWLPIQSN
ncbi:esterase [Gracilibacillus boraciitolerans JCM 21714]|uniref:Esterase n=1 Tax=Gracilibacillus boraciitolerans JCM 21714 TaxID=1298598 RepID=W4VQ58_9BACI|nr:alpha/beta hydrolase family protein [Gracilibacillus boraciitolerans]GAE94899.1 esterase [Gracilibacillus boraciitolerans JCM 21714]